MMRKVLIYFVFTMLIFLMGCSNKKIDTSNTIRKVSGITAEKMQHDEVKLEEYGIAVEDTNVQLDNVIKKKTVLGKEINYIESYCKYLNDQKSEYGSFYSIYDCYSNDTYTAWYLNGCDLLCYYSLSYEEIQKYKDVPSEIDKQEAEKIITEFVKNNSKVSLADYDLYSWDIDNKYSYSFVKRIDGYTTDEKIHIEISRNGVILYYDAKNVNKYSYLKDITTKDKIDLANTRLINKINGLKLNNVEMSGEPTIITSTYGEVFLVEQVSFKDESEYSIKVIEVYMKIE